MSFKQFIRRGKNASDITPLFLDREVFHQAVDELANLFSDQEIDKIAAVEGRGFILGSAVAYKLKVGFVPIRLKGRLQNEVFSKSYTDYSKKEKTLEIHKDAVLPNENILIIDDWIETGNTVKAVVYLVERCGGKVVGVGSLIDNSSEEFKKELGKNNYKYIEER